MIVVSQYTVFPLSGTDDENADNEIRRFAVVSYLDLLEKPVLPDVLVRVICWVSSNLLPCMDDSAWTN